MRGVAADAGLDHSTVHHYFTSKKELIEAVVGQSDPDPVKGAHAVSRATLRRILLAGLADVVTFGNPVLRRTALGFFRLCGAVPPLRQAVFAD